MVLPVIICIILPTHLSNFIQEICSCEAFEDILQRRSSFVNIPHLSSFEYEWRVEYNNRSVYSTFVGVWSLISYLKRYVVLITVFNAVPNSPMNVSRESGSKVVYFCKIRLQNPLKNQHGCCIGRFVIHKLLNRWPHEKCIGLSIYGSVSKFIIY